MSEPFSKIYTQTTFTSHIHGGEEQELSKPPSPEFRRSKCKHVERILTGVGQCWPERGFVLSTALKV